MAGNVLKAFIIADASGLDKESKKAIGSIGAMEDAFADLKKAGLVNIGAVEDALKQFKQALKIATDPEDIKRINQAITFLEREAKGLKGIGLDKHFDGIQRSTQKASTTALGFAKVIDLFPEEVQHLTHSFDGLLQSFEQIHSKTGSTKETFKELGKAFAGPLGIGVGITLVVGLLQSLGVELFNSEEAAHASEEALKSFGEQADRVKDKIKDLTSALQFQNELGAINIKINNQGDLQNLKEQTVAQQQFIVDLENQRDRIQRIGKQISDNEELSGEDRVKAEKDNSEDLKKVNEQLIEADRKLTLLYREQSLQRNEDAKKAAEENEKNGDKLIAEAKRIAAYFNSHTIRVFNFDVDPGLSKGQNIQRAIDFIKRALDPAQRQTFELKPQVAITPKLNIKPVDDKFFRDVSDDATKTYDQAKKAFEESVKRAGQSNPIVIKVNADLAAARQHQSDLFSAIGITKEGINAAQSTLTDFEKDAINLANTFSNILGPAVGDFFGAIAEGKNPIEAFFGTLKQAIQQVIQKLISAAITALIFNAILGKGGPGFGSLFKGFAGFRAGGGPVQAGKDYIVGEKGPEIFTPNTGGRIIANSQISTGRAVNNDGMQVMVAGEFLIAGNNLKAVLAAVDRSQQRLT